MNTQLPFMVVIFIHLIAYIHICIRQLGRIGNLSNASKTLFHACSRYKLRRPEFPSLITISYPICFCTVLAVDNEQEDWSYLHYSFHQLSFDLVLYLHKTMSKKTWVIVSLLIGPSPIWSHAILAVDNEQEDLRHCFCTHHPISHLIPYHSCSRQWARRPELPSRTLPLTSSSLLMPSSSSVRARYCLNQKLECWPTSLFLQGRV